MFCNHFQFLVPFLSFTDAPEIATKLMINIAADVPSDPHLEGQTRILANEPTFSSSNFVLALME